MAAPETFAGLTPEEELLLFLREELYAGSWEEMERDLIDRLNGRPYVFKLVHRIQDDLGRLRRLRELEARTGRDLARERAARA